MDYQRIKRGNVFENLYKIDEDGREMVDEEGREETHLTQTLRNFSRVDEWIARVNTVASETKRDIDDLKSQIAAMKVEIDEGDFIEDEDDLEVMDNYFRESQDHDDSYLHQDLADKERLREEEISSQQDRGQGGEVDLEEGEDEKGETHFDEVDQVLNPWKTQTRRQRGKKKVGASGNRESRRRRKIPSLPAPSNPLHRRRGALPQQGRQVQGLGNGAGPVPQGTEAHGPLQHKTQEKGCQDGGQAHQDAAADENCREEHRAGPDQVGLGGRPLLPPGGRKQEIQEDGTLRQIEESMKAIKELRKCVENFDRNYIKYCDIMNFINLDLMCQEFDMIEKDLNVKRGREIPQCQGTNHNLSEKSLDMARIPSRCERCGQDFPSKQALQNHKSKEHSSKPPGPPMKAKDKDAKVAKVPPEAKEAVKEAKARQPQTPGSALTMDRWIRGEARATMVGAAMAQARTDTPPRRDTPVADVPGTPEVRTVDLDASVSLLAEGASANEAAASPMLNTVTTLTVFPPVMVATPPAGASSNGSWTLMPARSVEPEPEKKRARAREDDVGGSEKKTDVKRTPEAVRLVERTPRNLGSELERLDDNQAEAQAMIQGENNMEVELGPNTLRGLEQLVNSGEWSQALAGIEEESGASALERSDTYREPRDMMSVSEVDWMLSATFDDIPGAQDQDQAQGQNDALIEAEDNDNAHELLRKKNEEVEELRSRLEEELSMKEENWDKIRTLEEQIAELVRQNSNMRQSMEAITDWDSNQGAELAETRVKLQNAETELQMVGTAAKSMKAEVDKMKAEVVARDEKMKLIKKQALKVVEEAKAHAEKMNSQEAQREKDDQQKRAETEKLKALNTRLLAELERQKATVNEIINLKATLAKLSAEMDLEKHKCEKASEVAKKFEEMLTEAQRDRDEKEKRIKDLEHRNKDLAQNQPCGRQECDYSCGRNHHCGVGRQRNRGQRVRARGVSLGDIPTTANLADQAGVQVEDMQEVVDEVQYQQDQGAARFPPRSQQKKPWKVVLCPDYHYNKVCARGDSCRNAHELQGANDVARSRPRPSSMPPPGPPGQGSARPQGAGRGKKKFTIPAYNPEHPHHAMWARNVASSSRPLMRPAENSNGQGNGAALVQPQQPQVQPRVPQPQPQPPQQRPRSYSEAASGMARQTVREAMEQQASVNAHLSDMEDPAWTAALEAARGAFRGQPSQGSLNSGEAARSASIGDLTSASRRSGQ